MRNGKSLQGSQGALDLYDDIPLTLDDDPEIDLRDLATVAPVGRRGPDPDPASVRAMFAELGWSVTE